MKTFSYLALALMLCTVPAFAAVTVSTPVNNAQVTSPFNLIATASACSSQPVSAMGYSIDNSSNTTIINGAQVNAQVASIGGAHTVHVKSWGNQGASCTTDVPVIVVQSALATVPPDAIAIKNVEALKAWQGVNDTGIAGTGISKGTMSMVATPLMKTPARKFATSYSNSAGQRYYTTLGADTNATNFLYDGYIYIGSSTNGIGNIEMDMNQVMANGQTVIFGFQCDGYTKTWDYTVNDGTPQAPIDAWRHSQQACNPRAWSINTWHHVQISYSRDNQGTVTYQSVWLDGVQQDLYVTAPSAFALGWGSTLLTNFQIDGYGASGSSNVYIDNLTIYRW